MSVVQSHPHNGILASSTEPKLSQRTGTFGKHSGRRLTSAPSSQDKKDEGARIFPTNASMEEIDKMLEDDAFALLNIKKEITNSQQEELAKLRVAVMAAKKDHDSLHIANNILEKEVGAYQAKITNLQGVDKSSLANNFAMQDIVNDLTERNSEVLEELAAEQRTIKMLSLMIKRYDAEIAQCRLDTAKAITHVEHAKHDLAVCEHSVQNNRQELLELELEHEKMQATVKQRQDQREGKISMLHTLSVEGEQSVARLQQSLMETTKRTQHRENKSRNKTAGLKVGTPRNASEPEEDEFPEGGDLAVVARRMTIEQVREVVQRYKSQSSRMEKLHQLDSDLRSNIAMQQRKKHELSEQLGQAEFKIQQLASSRQIYQEVDLKDSALAATSKECDDCKDRDFRLRLNIESLKQSIPRFLTKVTKVIHPKPTETQLGDAVLKLDDELTKLIKVIGSALLKDATPDDLAMMSQQSAASGVSGEAHSEFARLQRLPGYARMKRQLFYNLMTARPDVSEQNIRIDHVGKVKQPKSTLGNPPLVPGSPNRHNPHNGHGPGVPNTNANVSPRGKKIAAQASQNTNDSRPDSTEALMDDKIFAEDASLDRNTIKNISKLIYERDYNKSKLIAIADAAKKNSY